MKKTVTKTGWSETTIKNINITSLCIPGNPFATVDSWTDFNKRYPKIGKKRKACNRCGEKWKSGYVNLIFTDKGNKSVCDKCYEYLKNNTP